MVLIFNLPLHFIYIDLVIFDKQILSKVKVVKLLD